MRAAPLLCTGGAPLWLLALLLVGCGAEAPPRPPNLLLLVVDCLRGDALSVAGYPRPTTPHIDALARAGTRFTRAQSQASWTRPSLPTILTGLYPSEHGLLDLTDDPAAPSAALDPTVVTLAERLEEAGYATGMVGDQHQLSPRFGLQQGFDLWLPRASRADNIHRRFLEWQGGLAGRPFFAYLHYLELHWPYCPPQQLRGRFSAEIKSDLNLCADWRGLRDAIRSGERVLGEEDRRLLRARYDEELLGVDGAIGELVAELQRRGVYDDTLIVVTGDHGEEFFEHGGFFHGQSLHGELLHVPLVWKPPAAWQAPADHVVDGLTEQRNLAATLLDAAGVASWPSGTDSLLPWIRGERDDAPSRFAVSEGTDQIALREGRWKMIAGRNGGGYQLYDLRHDPGERHDVAREERPRLAVMRQLLGVWKKNLRPTRTARVLLDSETREGLGSLGYIGNVQGKPSPTPTPTPTPSPQR